jgi:hypothetical protein
MSVIQGGINLGAPILPATEDDIFPTHDARYGKGGYRAVADISVRDAIPQERRDYGMIVHTLDTGLNWVWRANNGGQWQLTNAAISVDSIAAMLALPATLGTIVNRTDLNAVYVLNSDNPADIASWLEISNTNLDGGTF